MAALLPLLLLVLAATASPRVNAHYNADSAGVWPLGTNFHFESTACIDDPLAYAKAFVSGGSHACVDQSILLHLVVGEIGKDDLVKRFLTGFAQGSMLWSYDANPAKVLRIGMPQHLGNNNKFQPSGRGNYTSAEQYSNPNFQGLKYKSTYLALMEHLGWSSDLSNPMRMHMLVIAKRRADTFHFIPTWANLAEYFTQYVRVFGGPAYRKFHIHKEVLDLLRNYSFAELTGCKAMCTFQDALWAGHVYQTAPGPLIPDWDTPTCGGYRANISTCMPNADCWFTDGVTRSVPTEPISIEPGDEFCENADWRRAVLILWVASWRCATTNAYNATLSQLVALRMADMYREAGTMLNKTMVFRAFLMSPCAGGYGPLFSGDGMTYMGSGGLLRATGGEIATGFMNPDRLLQDAKYVFFCPYDELGRPSPGAQCLTSTCNVCAGNEVLPPPPA